MIAFMTVQGHIEHFSFIGVAERQMSINFSSCQAAQTAATNGVQSLYHEAELLFYRKRYARCGTALVVILSYETHSEILLGHLALKFVVWLKQLLWAVSNLLIKFAVSHVHCDIWGMCNN